jgi:hypothetical protein
MNGNDIHRVLLRLCSPEFVGVFARDQLLIIHQRPALLVVNTDESTKRGEHWVAIYLGANNYGEYFDSFAQQPHTDIVLFLNKYCLHWTRSDRQIQSISSYLCGNYVLFFCFHRKRGLDLQKITRMFSNDTGWNDMLVHRIVCRTLING